MHEISAQKPCRRCLLSQMPGEKELQAVIAERLSLMEVDEKAGEDMRRQRLAVCQSCDQLNSGTCGLCGCYVELRAARKRMACPHVPKKW